MSSPRSNLRFKFKNSIGNYVPVLFFCFDIGQAVRKKRLGEGLLGEFFSNGFDVVEVIPFGLLQKEQSGLGFNVIAVLT